MGQKVQPHERFSALAGAIAFGDFLAGLMKGNRLGQIARESLTIGGWVSMWRPLEVFLYDWWPIRNEARLSERLSAMPIRIRYPMPRVLMLGEQTGPPFHRAVSARRLRPKHVL